MMKLVTASPAPIGSFGMFLFRRVSIVQLGRLVLSTIILSVTSAARALSDQGEWNLRVKSLLFFWNAFSAF